MPKQNQFDKQFQGKPLADLEALKTGIATRLQEFIACGNTEQAVTYTRVQEALERAITAQRVQQEPPVLFAPEEAYDEYPAFIGSKEE